MKKWETNRLVDIADIQLGKMLSPKSKTGTASFPYLRNANVQWNRFDLADLAEMDFDKREREKFALKKGDILCCEGGEPGRSAIWDGQVEPCFYQKALHRIRLRNPEGSPRCLLYRIWHSSNAGEFDSGHAKTTIAHLPLSTLENLKISFPSDPSEQHRIAAELDEQLSAIDEARAAAERRVAAAEALEAALLREHFHGLTPVRIGLPKEAAPAAWKWTQLLELADLESGHTPSRKHPEWWGGDIPWLALPDIRALDGKVAMETKENTNKLGIANSSARILPKDTVALSRTASVGFVTIFGRPMATSQDFVNWTCGKNLSPAFLLHALRASREHFLANASGAIHKTLYMPAVKDFHLCHPARKTQESLAAALSTRLADAATLLTAARAELAAIQALPASALGRVFAA